MNAAQNRILSGALAVVLLAACSSGHKSTAGQKTGIGTTSTSQKQGEPTSRAAPPCQTSSRTYTSGQLAALRPSVDEMVGRNGTVGTGARHIVVFLFAGRDQLAAMLERQYGNAVTITVGTAPYHCGVGRSKKCPDLTGTDALPAGMHLTLRPDAASMSASKPSLNGKLIVREDSTTPLAMDPGQPIIAAIVKPGTRTVVGQYGGIVSGTGLGLNLKVGEEASIPTLIGAWRCDGEIGSTVPPGTYGLRAGIGPNEGKAEFLAPEIPFTVTS
jgi:hypothetical protein